MRLRAWRGRTLAGFSILGVVWGCSGPQPLSVALRPQEQQEFVPVLETNIASPKAGFFKWKASQTGRSVEETAQADEAMSHRRNPFKANSDPEAVSRGAAIYKVHCQTCHGENADGRGPALANTTPRMNFHRFANRFAVTLHGGAPIAWFKKLSEGYTSKVANPDGTHNAMSPFKDVLAKEEIWLAITYLQSLDIHAPASQPAS